MKSLGSPGLFETKEDGTIIYYGKMGAPGFIVDKPTMSAIRGLYFKVFVALVLVITPLIYSGHRWAGIAIAVIVCALFYLQHQKIIKTLPVSSYSRPGFRRRSVLISADAPYWILILSVLFFPFVGLVGFSKIGDPSVNPLLTWLVIAIAFILWLVNVSLLIVKIRVQMQRRKARAGDPPGASM